MQGLKPAIESASLRHSYSAIAPDMWYNEFQARFLVLFNRFARVSFLQHKRLTCTVRYPLKQARGVDTEAFELSEANNEVLHYAPAVCLTIFIYYSNS